MNLFHSWNFLKARGYMCQATGHRRKPVQSSIPFEACISFPWVQGYLAESSNSSRVSSLSLSCLGLYSHPQPLPRFDSRVSSTSKDFDARCAWPDGIRCISSLLLDCWMSSQGQRVFSTVTRRRNIKGGKSYIFVLVWKWTPMGPLRVQPGNTIHFSGSGQNPQPGAAWENAQVCKLTPWNQPFVSNTHSQPGHSQNLITKSACVLFPTPELKNPATTSDSITN